MIEMVKPFAEWSATFIEIVGIGFIVVFSIYALVVAVFNIAGRTGRDAAFAEFRQRLGRGILIGLEFLVAADIIHTVAVELTLETVGVLAIIVLIRTFLSFALEVELNGRWPWRRHDQRPL